MPNFWTNLKAKKQPFLALAPLDGVTDYVFREIVSQTAKPDVLFTEFTHTDALLSKGYAKTIERFRYSEGQHPIVAQIWGTHPESFRKAAQMAKELRFDGIDINMGCPNKTVMKSGGGSAMIRQQKLAADIISATKESADEIPVSVKTRIGIDQIITEQWISFLLDQNIAALTVHGRTADEMSKVAAHWDEIGLAVELKNNIAPYTVLLGNGDVTSQSQAKELHVKYGIDGVMIGRGIFANPWLFEPLEKEHSTKEYLELLLRHTKLYCETYPERKRFDTMKKFFKNYVKGFSGSNKLKIELMAAKNYEEVEALIVRHIK